MSGPLNYSCFRGFHPLKSNRSPNFSQLEADTLAFEVEVSKEVLSGNRKTGVKGAPRDAVWRKMAAGVGSVAGLNKS